MTWLHANNLSQNEQSTVVQWRRCDTSREGGDWAEPNAKPFSQPIVFERTIYGDSADMCISLRLDLTDSIWRAIGFWCRQAAIIFSFVIGIVSRKVCIRVLPKHQRP